MVQSGSSLEYNSCSVCEKLSNRPPPFYKKEQANMVCSFLFVSCCRRLILLPKRKAAKSLLASPQQFQINHLGVIVTLFPLHHKPVNPQSINSLLLHLIPVKFLGIPCAWLLRQRLPQRPCEVRIADINQVFLAASQAIHAKNTRQLRDLFGGTRQTCIRTKEKMAILLVLV